VTAARVFTTRPIVETTMALEPLIIFLAIGAIAGWLAGEIVKGYGFGLVGNMLVGVIGSFIGGWLFTNLHLGSVPIKLEVGFEA
jgi:uncharacterized membrane protein YeaQ/YmgE (transglycosylase-associated protein family)